MRPVRLADVLRRWGWLLVVATAACSVAEAAVMRTSGVGFWSVQASRNAFPIVNLATVVGALVGAVIVSRHPHHRIGWLFCWGQLGVAAGLLMRAVADANGSSSVGAPPPAGELADLLANLLGSQFALLLLAVLLLLAPEGRLPSPRWRPALVMLAGSYLLISAGLVLIFVRGIDHIAEAIVVAGQLGVLAGLLASVAALVVRLRHAAGEMRQQLRWIAGAAALLATAPLAAVALNLAGAAVTPLWTLALLHVGYLAVPIATGFAVLRYRLYDIDRLMGGSVVLAVLAVLAVGGYIGAVGLIGSTVPDAYPGWFSLIVFLLAVLAFQPIRGFVRRLADRLVYGSHSMSYEALTRFTRELVSTSAGAPFLAEVAKAAGRLVNARRSTAVVEHPTGREDRASWTAEAADPAEPLTSWVVPVHHQGAAVGRLELELPVFPTGAARRRELLESLAARVAEGFVHARLERSLREHAEEFEPVNQALEISRQRLLAARDIGRRRVADRIEVEVVDRLIPVAASVSEIASNTTEPSRVAHLVDEALELTTVPSSSSGGSPAPCTRGGWLRKDWPRRCERRHPPRA